MCEQLAQEFYPKVKRLGPTTFGVKIQSPSHYTTRTSLHDQLRGKIKYG